MQQEHDKYEKINHNMIHMNLLFAESGKSLDIHLILWWIPSAIQVIPLNEVQGDANELYRKINNWAQRICDIVFRYHVG